MPVELTYFTFKGLGEQIRLLLAYGGVDFKDTRLDEESAEWQSFKSKTPFGQLPMINIDGEVHAQSFAISRYLGRKFGLAGANIEEDFEIEQNLEFLNDLRLYGYQVASQPTQELRDKEHAETEHLYPDILKKLDEMIRANSGHLAVGKLTWADFVFAGQYQMLKRMIRRPDLDQQYPSFKKLHDNVWALPQLQKYIASSPKTE